jgi:hypothetical protein
MRWTGHIACIEEMINAYMMFGWKFEGKRPIEDLICRWEDTIKTYLKQDVRLYIRFIGLRATSISC